jgi:hypothetical protein
MFGWTIVGTHAMLVCLQAYHIMHVRFVRLVSVELVLLPFRPPDMTLG